MVEFRSDSLNELLANFEFARVKEYVERRDPGTASTDEAPVETAPAPSASIGMFMPSSAPELRGRKNLAMFLERFYTWGSVAGCDSALDSNVSIKTSGTPRAELERLYNRALVHKPLQVWQSLTKALEKEPEIMKMVMEISSPSEAWRALSKIAAETEDDAYDRAKREFETLEIGANETVSEYFARVNIVLMKLERHDITTPARETKRIVLKSLTPRFPNDTSMLAMKGDFDLSELEHELARVGKLRSDSSRSAASHALAVAHAGGGQTGTGDGARGQGRQGRRSGGRHDDGSKDIRRRCTMGGSTSHPRRCRNSRTHGNNSSSSSTSRNFHSHNSWDRTTSSPTPGAAGENHPTSSGEEERTTSVDHDIGEGIRLTSSA